MRCYFHFVTVPRLPSLYLPPELKVETVEDRCGE